MAGQWPIRSWHDATGTEPEKLVEGDGPHLLAWRDWVEPAEVDDARPGGFEPTVCWTR